MAASQAEFAAFKADTSNGIKKLEGVLTTAMDEITKLKEGYALISIQAAPWSASIQAEVAASEAKAEAPLGEVRSLYTATKSEVEDLKRRATESERKVFAPAARHRGSEGNRPLILSAFKIPQAIVSSPRVFEQSASRTYFIRFD